MPPKTRGNWHKAFDVQMALYAWYQTKLGGDWMFESHAVNSKGIDHENTIALSRDLYTSEMGRLVDCDPIFVSADMCELIDFAKESFEPEALVETDIITPRAFLYFETPFNVLDRYDTPIEVQAFSWTRIISSNVATQAIHVEEINEALAEAGAWAEEIEGGMRVHAGDRTHEAAKTIEEILLEHGATATGLGVTVYVTTKVEKMHGEMRLYEYPPVIPIHLTPWYFGMSFEGNEVDINGIPTGAIWWWKILQTSMRMMQQKVAVRHHVRPDRAGRREMQRHGYRPETETVVVRLRGEEAERKEPSGEKANYSHRFIRRGHWRNQPYPSEDLYRQIWIDPTIVGDPELPLRVKPRRAFQWSR